MAVMIILALAAVVLLMNLPRWAPPKPAISLPTPNGAAAAAAMAEPAAPEAPPDDDELTGIARRNAQILLRASLARVTELQARQVESWDRSGLHQLNEHILHGEKAYTEKRFRAAQDAYRAALTEAARLEARLPAVIAELLAEGENALEQGNSAQAATAFEHVLAMAPEQREARLGRARAGTLDRVRALVEQAEAYEQMGEADKARAVYDDAARLDARTASVKTGLARLDRQAREQRLRDALSAGHVALERGDFTGARQAFKRAAAIDAHSADVLAGQRETERRAAAAEIATALERANRAVKNEAWLDAARSYGAALALDAELSVAAEGKRAAEQRAQLDGQLENLRKDVLALATEPRRALAIETLSRARAVPQAGARLRAQMAALDSALRQAREPVEVTLLSDGQSDVSLDGRGALGRFSQHQLTLAPGHYRALVRRDGQTDVRIEFTITPGAGAPRITLKNAP